MVEKEIMRRKQNSQTSKEVYFNIVLQSQIIRVASSNQFLNMLLFIIDHIFINSYDMFPYLSDGLQITNRFQLINSVALRFTIGATFWNRSFASTSSNSDSVNHKSWKQKE